MPISTQVTITTTASVIVSATSYRNIHLHNLGGGAIYIGGSDVTTSNGYKLLTFLDAGRINLSSAEADLNDTKNPYNSGASASRYVFALFQQRLQEEALKLSDKYPIRIHYTK